MNILEQDIILTWDQLRQALERELENSNKSRNLVEIRIHRDQLQELINAVSAAA